MRKYILGVFFTLFILMLSGCCGARVRPENTVVKGSNLVDVDARIGYWNGLNIVVTNKTQLGIDVLWKDSTINGKKIKNHEYNGFVEPGNWIAEDAYVDGEVNFPMNLSLKVRHGMTVEEVDMLLRDVGDRVTVQRDHMTNAIKAVLPRNY